MLFFQIYISQSGVQLTVCKGNWAVVSIQAGVSNNTKSSIQAVVCPPSLLAEWPRKALTCPPRFAKLHRKASVLSRPTFPTLWIHHWRLQVMSCTSPWEVQSLDLGDPKAEALLYDSTNLGGCSGLAHPCVIPGADWGFMVLSPTCSCHDKTRPNYLTALYGLQAGHSPTLAWRKYVVWKLHRNWLRTCN